MKNIDIPVGISDFAEIRKNNFYYIDKTGLIEELLKTTATKVTLITRPRRFGKTLGMSMLENFFDIRKDSKLLFEGLVIADKQALCEKWMNQYPVMFLSLKSVDGNDFLTAYSQLAYEIGALYKEHDYLLESPVLGEEEKKLFWQIKERQAGKIEIMRSLQILSQLLNKHYKKEVILLIDEYDVPIAKATSNGYYREMLEIMKGLMQALKDNPSLRFAVITGCLKIAKESIFTGTNNFVSDTITDTRLNEYFGFVQSEVDQILRDANFTDKADLIKKWYDGYHFGDFDVYCPSESLLDAILDMDGTAVAAQIEKIHNEYVSVIQYHNENSLSSVLAIAYLSAMQYYFKPIRELPTGRGFADFVFVPKPEYKNDYPALIVELKWNMNA